MKRDTLFEAHPLADLLPRIGGAEYDALRDDIKANGLQQPIVLCDGKVLDGRHRLDVCNELGIGPRLVEYKGADPVGYVLSMNLHRRHLTPGQQATVKALAIQWAEAQSGKLAGSDGAKKSGKLAAQSEPKKTHKEIADEIGVGERTYRDAEKVAKVDPELSKEVAKGTVTLPEAVEKITGKRPGKKAPAPLELAELARELDAVREQRDQLAADNATLIAENEAMGKIIDADDKLKAAYAEVKTLQGQVRKLEARIAGLQNEKNAAIRAAKSAQRKAK